MRRFVGLTLALAAPACTSSTSVESGPVPARVTILGPRPLYADIYSYERLTAHVYDSAGALLDARVRVSWSSGDTSIVVVDQAGTLTFRRLGVTLVRAAVDTNGVHATDSVEVNGIRAIPVDKSP